MYMFHISFRDYLDIAKKFGGYRDESQGEAHPQFFYEDDSSYLFYFPIGSIIYFATIHKASITDFGFDSLEAFEIEHLKGKLELQSEVSTKVNLRLIPA